MLVVVDFKAGNLGSIVNIVKKVCDETPVVTSDPSTILRASKLILPGVGSFDHGAKTLVDSGLAKSLDDMVMRQGIPILGICLGMQLFVERSEEGRRSGLGWIPGEAVRFPSEFAGQPVKVPHMGWNRVRWRTDCRLATGLGERERFYFVHSYHVVCRKSEDIVGTTPYANEFVSAICRGNIYGVQFHPEKSHRYGMQLLRNFASL